MSCLLDGLVVLVRTVKVIAQSERMDDRVHFVSSASVVHEAESMAESQKAVHDQSECL